ncbi:MAG: hypothetical protein ABWZ99_09475, partial [Ilumatobacteraceae bacterium]
MPCPSRHRPPETRSTAGPAVVRVHGVGVGPEAFVDVAGRLAADGRTVHRIVRPGYDDTVPSRPHGFEPFGLDAQVDLIIEGIMQRKEQPTVWVGVSGGATLG